MSDWSLVGAGEVCESPDSVAVEGDVGMVDVAAVDSDWSEVEIGKSEPCWTPLGLTDLYLRPSDT